MEQVKTWKWGTVLTAQLQNNPRYLAIETLERIEKNQAYSNLEINQVINENELIREDANLYTELVYGVTQRRLTLDYFLEPYIKNPKKIQSWVRQLLRLSVYQSAFLDRIPAHAIINEAVVIAKKRGHQGVGNLVNAILRNIQRDGLRSFDEIQDPMERLSVEYSMPLPLVQRFVSDYGEVEATKLMTSLLERSNASGRVNLSQISREEVIEEAKDFDIELEKSDVSHAGVVADKGRLSSLPAFKEGKLTIQDETSMLVAEALQVESDHRVLDACAAPGGKTTHIADYLSAEDHGEVIALDLHDNKVKLIKQNAERQNVVDVVQAQTMDAKTVQEHFELESFDRILVDAPCSGLGLARRKPDLKYTKTEDDFKHLQKVQMDILEAVLPLLKKDGILVYSTCTIVKEENQDVVHQLLEKHPELKIKPLNFEDSVIQADEEGYVSILPHQFHTDGFFICALSY